MIQFVVLRLPCRAIDDVVFRALDCLGSRHIIINLLVPTLCCCCIFLLAPYTTSYCAQQNHQQCLDDIFTSFVYADYVRYGLHIYTYIYTQH